MAAAPEPWNQMESIVIVPVSAGSVGEIQISMVSGTRRMIARSASNELIPAGTAVRIVELTGSVALIERLDQQAVAAAKPQRVEG